jgi:hypothetical protein
MPLRRSLERFLIFTEDTYLNVLLYLKLTFAFSVSIVCLNSGVFLKKSFVSIVFFSNVLRLLTFYFRPRPPHAYTVQVSAAILYGM